MSELREELDALEDRKAELEQEIYDAENDIEYAEDEMSRAEEDKWDAEARRGDAEDELTHLTVEMRELERQIALDEGVVLDSEDPDQLTALEEIE